ncbi:hypothetical protein M0L20_23180 [Spirosoma sp. RP8]|uniref:Uncharacterized protein n=1 Tax=Spirosoma liriopis TaxID=2937440 RepID=A0ABT0HRH6_9BACT|nr:hypothetical protein [Spirosoma liriopis]MCK8494791.1 hypothetical protein [Spirosoma liriopis]
MNKREPDYGSQNFTYQVKLPAQFTSWNGFYDELFRLGLIQPTTTIVRINLFRATDTIKENESPSVSLTFERQHIERMCLEEYRQQRTIQASYLPTVQELEQLIQIVSNQATRLNDWDLLLKLNALLHYKQQQENEESNHHVQSGH